MQIDMSARARCRSAAYKAATGGKCTELLRDFWKQERVAPIDNRGDNILHFLAVNGNVAGLKILDGLSSKDVEITNDSGNTPLHEAVRFGKKEVVEFILGMEKDLVLMHNKLGEAPLYVAAASGEREIFDLLADYDFSEVTMKRNDGKTVLHAAVAHDCYNLAIHIVDLYPNLVNERDNKDMTALNLLAAKPLSFRSGSDYLFSEMGKTPSVPAQMIETIIYARIPPQYKTEAGSKVVCIERFTLTNYLLGHSSWLQAIDEAKQKHILALILGKMLLKGCDWNYEKNVPNPLMDASKLKIDELSIEILRMHPETVEALDKQGKNILHIAAEHKNRFLFDYCLKETVASKHRMLADVDDQGNTVLHLAANVGSPFRTSTTEHIESVWCVMSVLMMMWGVLWFKYVKYHVHPRLWEAKNSNGETAEELFEKNHLHIRKEAEEAIRNLSNSTLVLSTLLCTINFAAIFTVPGGFNEKSGLPILLDKVQQELWMLMFYLGAALFSSVFTMGTLLSFLLCKFYSSDFYIALPVKIIISIISVLYATAFTILACLQALNLENIVLNKDVWWLIIAVVAVGFIMALIYVDLAFPVFDYMYYLVYYSFFVSYKRGHK